MHLTILVVVALALVVSCQTAATPTPAATAKPAATTAPTVAAAATPAPTVAATKPAATPAAATPAATKPAASGPNIDRIKSAGKLVVLIDATFRPMEFKDEQGRTVGFDIDLANEFAKSLGVTAEFQNVNWDGIFVSLQQGKGDVIMSSVTITEERKKEMAFSNPYYLAGQVIVVPASDTAIKGPNDLSGKTVAVQIDTTGQEAAEKITGIKEIRKFDGGAEALLAVEQKKVDATIIDAMVALDYVKEHSASVKAADRKPFTTEEIGAAFKKDATDLVTAFNSFVNAAKADGRMDTILNKWGLKTS
jgi:polar amino acid transport system substrate-binding protein